MDGQGQIKRGERRRQAARETAAKRAALTLSEIEAAVRHLRSDGFEPSVKNVAACTGRSEPTIRRYFARERRLGVLKNGKNGEMCDRSGLKGQLGMELSKAVEKIIEMGQKIFEQEQEIRRMEETIGELRGGMRGRRREGQSIQDQIQSLQVRIRALEGRHPAVQQRSRRHTTVSAGDESNSVIEMDQRRRGRPGADLK